MNFDKKITSFIGISALAVLMSAPGFAQMNRPATPNPAPNPPSNTTPNSPSSTTPTAPTATDTFDREFITMAAQGNNAEIQMSQLALQRATDEDVREYAQRMIDEHTAANQQLEPIAAERGITLPTTPSSFDTAVFERLSQIPEASFDQAYMDTQVNAHLKSAAVFRTGAQQSEDAALQNYAITLLPSIQDHLEMASQMAENYNAQQIR